MNEKRDSTVLESFLRDYNNLSPYEFEDMVILGVLSRLMLKTDDPYMAATLQRNIASERVRIGKLYMEKRRTGKRELDSFTWPVVPLVEETPEVGELDKEF